MKSDIYKLLWIFNYSSTRYHRRRELLHINSSCYSLHLVIHQT